MVSYMFSEPVVNGKCFPENLVLAQPAIGDFSNGIESMFSKTCGPDYRKYMIISEALDGPGNP
jgi:hypothetical protein